MRSAASVATQAAIGRRFLLCWVPLAAALMAPLTVGADQPSPGTPAQEEPLEIIVSVRPLALMVQDVAGDRAQVEVLLPNGASPHHYSLRMSDMQRLQDADLFVWIGPEFERFLAKPLARKNADAVLTASTVAGLVWPASGDAAHHDEDHDGRDMHLWLNPENGKAVMEAVAQRLSALRPAQASHFRANLSRATAQLEQVSRRVSARLSPVRDRGFGVSHDGFGHFVDAFRLKQIAAISILSDRALGARQVMALKKALAPAQCLIVEAGDTPAAVADWQRLFDLTPVVADPLALDPAIQSYPALIADLGESFATCLAGRQR